MINGTHIIIYSADSEKDRAFFRDILKLTNVDVGRGWLIFGLPPSELAVHPAAGNELHELYLMCDDIKAFAKQMSKHRIACSAIQDQGWGLVTQLTLPGGGKLGVYQPRHTRPKPTLVKVAKKAGSAVKIKKAVKKKPLKKIKKK